MLSSFVDYNNIVSMTHKAVVNDDIVDFVDVVVWESTMVVELAANKVEVFIIRAIQGFLVWMMESEVIN